jgi:3-oxoacyl-[acyl-carrier protein] reductase
MTDQSVEQRVAMVTGASRGIGKAIAERLASDGRHVVLVARSAEPLAALEKELKARGFAASHVAVDVGDPKALQAAVEKIIEERGRLDIIVNNAGVTKDNLTMRMSDDDFADVLRINLMSAFVTARAACRAMIKNRFGRIVNIGSTSGVVGNAGQANYAAAKAGLIGLARSLARELGGKGITANVIAPGFIETDMTANLPEEVRRGVMAMMSIRRFGTPDDIAAAVSYVSSDEAGFLTGQVICVDGGMTMA